MVTRAPRCSPQSAVASLGAASVESDPWTHIRQILKGEHREPASPLIPFRIIFDSYCATDIFILRRGTTNIPRTTLRWHPVADKGSPSDWSISQIVVPPFLLLFILLSFTAIFPFIFTLFVFILLEIRIFMFTGVIIVVEIQQRIKQLTCK